MLSAMNTPELYMIIFLGAIATVIFIRQSISISKRARSPVYGWVLRHIIYPRLFENKHLVNPGRGDVVLHLLHWGTTAAFNTIGIKEWSQASVRAAQIAIVHVFPLLASRQLSFVADLVGLSLGSMQKLHASFGTMAFVQGLLHVVISAQGITLSSSSVIFGMAVSPSSSALEVLSTRTEHEV